MNIATAHQPAYLPWLGYFHKISLSDEFVLLDSVQFEKNSFTNRNKIKVSNGEAWLTIPVEMKGHINRNINEMVIDEKFDWRKKHWNSLLMNYKKSPYFSIYSDFFESYYKNTTTSNLSEFIKTSTIFFLKELDITPKYTELSTLELKSKKQELIVDICKNTKSDLFVFGSQGKDYADLDYFKKNNISCYFQDYKHPNYDQLWNEFKPFMSIVDCLFNNGSKKTKEIILENNTLKTNLL
jgi:hypothetical protein